MRRMPGVWPRSEDHPSEDGAPPRPAAASEGGAGGERQRRLEGETELERRLRGRFGRRRRGAVARSLVGPALRRAQRELAKYGRLPARPHGWSALEIDSG